MLKLRTLALAVPLLGLAEWGAHHYFARRAPTPADWQRVAEHVRAARTADELVVVAPRWAEPMARQAMGDDLMPLAHVARADETAFESAIEISALNQRAAGLGTWSVSSEERIGPFMVRKLANPTPAKVRFDFLEQLSPKHASAYETNGRQRRDCRWSANSAVTAGGLHGAPTFPKRRFACAGGREFFVGVTVLDDNHEYRPRRCIWAHPTRFGSIGVTFKNVPLGRVIRGYGLLPWFFSREWKGPPITLTVRIDGREIGKYIHRDRDGFTPFEFPTGAQGGQKATVEFEVASSTTKQRDFCFQADTR